MKKILFFIALSVVTPRAFATVEISMVEGDRFNFIMSSQRDLNGEAFLFSCGALSQEEQKAAELRGRNAIVANPSDNVIEFRKDVSTGSEQTLKITCRKRAE